MRRVKGEIDKRVYIRIKHAEGMKTSLAGEVAVSAGEVIKMRTFIHKSLFPLLPALLALSLHCGTNPAKGAKLQIVNGSSYTVYDLYLFTDSTALGRDWLGTEITSNKSDNVSGLPQGLFSIRIRTFQGECTTLGPLHFTTDSSSLIILADSLFSKCGTGPGNVRIVNLTDSTIYNLFIYPSGGNPGKNYLGSTGPPTISPSGSFQVDSIPAGIYDIMVETYRNTSHDVIAKQTVEEGQTPSTCVINVLY